MTLPTTSGLDHSCVPFHTKLTFSGNVSYDRFGCSISPPYELVFGRICNLGITACHQIVTRCSDGFLTRVLFLPQGCMDKHRVMGILRQMEKFLKGQEIRFTEGLRIMKSKLTNLQNSLSKLPQADQSSCKCHNTWHIHTSRYINGLCECEVSSFLNVHVYSDLLFPHMSRCVWCHSGIWSCWRHSPRLEDTVKHTSKNMKDGNLQAASDLSPALLLFYD